MSSPWVRAIQRIKLVKPSCTPARPYHRYRDNAVEGAAVDVHKLRKLTKVMSLIGFSRMSWSIQNEAACGFYERGDPFFLFSKGESPIQDVLLFLQG
jgi:hypothetical protein